MSNTTTTINTLLLYFLLMYTIVLTGYQFYTNRRVDIVAYTQKDMAFVLSKYTDIIKTNDKLNKELSAKVDSLSVELNALSSRVDTKFDAVLFLLKKDDYSSTNNN